MRALVFDFALPKLAAARMLGALSQRGYVSRLGPLALREVPDPALPADDWVIVETDWCGICGSDVKQVFLEGATDNPLTSVISFPHVLGHEYVGTVVEAGPGVTRVRTGDRVACYPWLSCEPRGLPPCPPCDDGQHTHCERFTDGALAPGIHAGNCRDVSGGFAPLAPVHESMCFPVPDGVEPDEAALADPFAVALHAVLSAPPEPGDTILIIGTGTLGLLAAHVARRLFDGVTILCADVHGHVGPLAERMGADRFTTATGAALVDLIGEHTGAAVRRPWNGLPWLAGGVDRVYDTVGSARTLELAVRVTRPRGSVVMVGVSPPSRFEWTPLYFKELRLLGASGYGVETFDGERRHAFDLYLDLARDRAVDARPIVTHRMPLDQWRDAFLVARDKPRHRSVKVLLSP